MTYAIYVIWMDDRRETVQYVCDDFVFNDKSQSLRLLKRLSPGVYKEIAYINLEKVLNININEVHNEDVNSSLGQYKS